MKMTSFFTFLGKKHLLFHADFNLWETTTTMINFPYSARWRLLEMSILVIKIAYVLPPGEETSKEGKTN